MLFEAKTPINPWAACRFPSFVAFSHPSLIASSCSHFSASKRLNYQKWCKRTWKCETNSFEVRSKLDKCFFAINKGKSSRSPQLHQCRLVDSAGLPFHFRTSIRTRESDQTDKATSTTLKQSHLAFFLLVNLKFPSNFSAWAHLHLKRRLPGLTQSIDAGWVRWKTTSVKRQSSILAVYQLSRSFEVYWLFDKTVLLRNLDGLVLSWYGPSVTVEQFEKSIYSVAR